MKNQQQPMPLHGTSSQSTCPKLSVDSQIPTIPAAQSSSKEFENICVTNKDEITKKYELNVLRRLKSKKKKSRRLLNRKYDLLSPKTSFMVFSELFQGVQIQLQNHPPTFLNSKRCYTATFEIDGQIYTANDISMTLAKEKVCEQFLRSMFNKKISKLSGKKEKSSKEIKVGDSSTVPIHRRTSLEGFPTEEFTKLATHNLINQWQMQNVSNAFNRRTRK